MITQYVYTDVENGNTAAFEIPQAYKTLFDY